MAVRATDILFRAGGATLKRLQTLVSGGAGRIEVAHTHTRADATTCATLRDRDAFLRQAPANVLRLDWPSGLVDAGGNAIAGPLSEGSRTNICLQSETFGTTWVPTRSSVSSNADTGPDGTVTADRLIEDSTATSTHPILQAVTITANGNFCGSVFAKAGSRSWIVLAVEQFASGANRARCFFNLATGAKGTASAAGTGALTGSGIEAVSANGFYRCWVSGSVGGGTTSGAFRIGLATGDGGDSYSGDGTSYVSLWGGHVENATTFPSSYIKTVASAVTRAADALTAPVNFGSQSDLTVLVRLARPLHADVTGALGVSPGIFSFGAGSAARIGAYFDPAARNIIGVIDTATTDQTVSAAIPAGNPTVSFQFKNLTTGGQVAIDTGSGLSAFSSAATAFSAFSSQTLRIGRYDDELYGVIGDMIVARGLQSRADMMAVP